MEEIDPTIDSQREEDDLLWQHLKTLPAFRALLRSVEARFYHQIPMPEPVLDVGCGDGDFAQHTFNEYGRRINIGVDPWIGPLTKSVQADVYDHAFQAFGDRMPFPDAYFQTAFSNSVLEHIPDIVPVLMETARVLKPGGRFIMTMPNHRFTEMLGGAQLFERIGLNPVADQYRTLFNFISRHAHTEPVEWWAENLAKCGLAVERWQYYFSPEALHALEIGHAQGLPSAILHNLTGKWIIAPSRSSLAPTDRWVRPFYLEQADLEGCYQLIVARKVSDGPISVEIPEAKPFKVLPNGDLQPDALDGEDAESLIWNSLPQASATQPANFADESAGPLEPANQTERSDISASWLGNLLIPGSAILFSIIFSFFAYTLSSGGQPTRPFPSLTIWLIAIGTLFFGLTQNIEDKSLFARFSHSLQSNRRAYVTGLLLFVAAIIVRMIRIESLPFILSGTEAVIGLEAVEMAGSSVRSPFGTGALTNPALPFVFIGRFITFWGQTVTGLRLPSILVGALTVPLLFALGRRLFSYQIGLVAALLLLLNHTSLHYSRLGLTNAWDPLLAVLTVLTIWIAWKDNDRRLWLLGGLFAGLGAYFFTASRVFPLSLSTALIILLIIDWKRLSSLAPNVLFMGIMALVVALPMVRFYNTNPGTFDQRHLQLGVLQTDFIEVTAAQNNQTTNTVWTDQIWRSISALWNASDQSTYYGAERGFLNFWAGFLMIVGFVISMRQFNRAESWLLILPIVAVVIVGGILVIETPSSHRYLIALPFAALLAAVGLDWLLMRVNLIQENPSAKWGVALAIVLLLGGTDLFYYFSTYQAISPPVFGDRNTEIAYRMADYLNRVDHQDQRVVYFHGDPAMYANFPTLPYLAPQFEAGRNLIDIPIISDGIHPFANAEGPLSIIILPERSGDVDIVSNQFAGGTLETIDGEFQIPLFFIYEVE